MRLWNPDEISDATLILTTMIVIEKKFLPIFATAFYKVLVNNGRLSFDAFMIFVAFMMFICDK